MSSGGDRKRGHDAVSDETDASARRLTKQRKPPPAPPNTEPRPLCLLDMPAGVVANIAQFVDIREIDHEGSSVRNGEVLMYLCLVFGRQTAQVVRREYLSNNLSYLDYLARETMYYSEQYVRMEKISRMKGVSNLNGALEQWMQANPWWKDACRDAAVFAKGGGVCAKYPPIYKTIEVKGFADNKERRKWNKALGTGRSSLVNLHFKGGPLGEDYTSVLAVDDVDLKNHSKEMTWEQVEEAMLKEGHKRFRATHTDFVGFFLNPAMAIDLGMFELFRFQVEELMLDVNCQDYVGLFFAGVDDDGDLLAGQPLLLHALLNPDKRFFDFLLTVADFEVNPVIQRDLKDGTDNSHRADTFLHRLPHILRCDLPKKIDLNWVAHMIKAKKIDLNVQNYDDLNPLEALCSAPLTKSDHDVAKMLLLSAGAEVTWTALARYATAKSDTETNSQVPKEFFLELLKE